MKRISRNKIEKIVEYCHFKSLSCRETSKLLRISKTTANLYYHTFLSLNLKYGELILLSKQEFEQKFYDIFTAKHKIARKENLFEILNKIFEMNSFKTAIDYWDEYTRLVLNPYKYSQFKHYFNEWLKQNNQRVSHIQLFLKELSIEDLKLIKKYKKSKDKNNWRKAKAILDISNGKPKKVAAQNIDISFKTIKRWINLVNNEGVEKLFEKKKKKLNAEVIDKVKLKKNRVIEILHQPPSLFGINRTTWDLKSIAKTYNKTYEQTISTTMISQYLKDEGYIFKKARKVLTSTDPNFREKLSKITEILSNLHSDEKFFSVDEFGPFAIKIQGGRSFMKKDKQKTYPQMQKSKGNLILTAALELSTNQMTYFYSEHKNTDEMIKLMYILIEQYKNQKKIYLSWDAASWHISKKLQAEVDSVNSKSSGTKVVLAPLPASSQFLNVIESVFSGMARAIIHNSNYKSVEDCKYAIELYFQDRNLYFMDNPKKAGKKIWGKEVVPPVFSITNNCKDPRYGR